MSHALEQMKAAGIGVICQTSSSKLPTSCLHGYSASSQKLHGSTFFWEAIFVTPTIVLAGTIHTLAWKMIEKCHLSFWYGILPGSFRFQTWCGDITDLQTKVTRGRLSQIRIKDHKEQICHCSRCAGHVGIFSMVRPSQQQDSVLRFSFPSWQVLHASVEPWVVALEGSQRWQYLLSSAPVPSCCMIGILSDTSPSQRTAQHAHKINEAATLIKQLRKRPYREAWGTCNEPWGFAGSLGCLQCLSLNSIQHLRHGPTSWLILSAP